MGKWCVAVLVVVTGATAGAILVVFRGGISARLEPARLEVAIAGRLRHLAIPARDRAAVNPMAASAQAIAEGRAHFADHCATCHANDGSGETEIGRSLYPRAPDMRRPETQHLSDGELFYIIEHGVRFTGMPAWGGAGRPVESWKLVHFIRHLPALTSEEKAEMERLNPRSAHEWREMQEENEFLEGGEPSSPRPAGRTDTEK